MDSCVFEGKQREVDPKVISMIASTTKGIYMQPYAWIFFVLLHP